MESCLLPPLWHRSRQAGNASTHPLFGKKVASNLLQQQLLLQKTHQAHLTSPQLNHQRPPRPKLLPQLLMRQAGQLLSWHSSKIGKQAVATTSIQMLLLP